MAEGIRVAVRGSYVIVYRVRGETAQIPGIVQGRRDLDALFDHDPLAE